LSGDTYELQVPKFGEALSDVEVVRWYLWTAGSYIWWGTLRTWSCQVILTNCRFLHSVRHSQTLKLSGDTYELQVPTFGEALSDLEVVRWYLRTAGSYIRWGTLRRWSCQVILMNCRFPRLVRHSQTLKLSGDTYELQVPTFGEALSDVEVVRW
jgi:hypothetical protein